MHLGTPLWLPKRRCYNLKSLADFYPLRERGAIPRVRLPPKGCDHLEMREYSYPIFIICPWSLDWALLALGLFIVQGEAHLSRMLVKISFSSLLFYLFMIWHGLTLTSINYTFHNWISNFTRWVGSSRVFQISKNWWASLVVFWYFFSKGSLIQQLEIHPRSSVGNRSGPYGALYKCLSSSKFS